MLKSLSNKKVILKVTQGLARPFVPDMCSKLIDEGFEIYQYIMADAILFHYNSGKSIPLVKNRFSKISQILSTKKIVNLLTRIDLVHFHTARGVFLYLRYLLNKRTDTFIVTIWGSEYYKREQKSWINNVILKKFYSSVDKITFTNPETEKDFGLTFPSLKNKLISISFPLKKLDIIDDSRNVNKLDALKKIGINTTKEICCIGYSASPFQRHLDILREVSKDECKWSEKYHFVLTMTYNGPKEYVDAVRDYLLNSKMDFTLFSSYLTDQQIALLRLSTDLFIHLPTTDQFSGSMQEVLYAGNKVLAGSWLPYSCFVNAGIHFYQIEEVSSLSDNCDAVDQMEFDKQKNIEAIYSISGFSVIIPKWKSFYFSLVSKTNNAPSTN